MFVNEKGVLLATLNTVFIPKIVYSHDTILMCTDKIQNGMTGKNTRTLGVGMVMYPNGKNNTINC